jgi:membrane-bound inhibitor of C-type lysozyme
MHDQIVKQWPFIRSYVMKDGHLFLALMADGGIFEFEPVNGTKPSAAKSPVASTGPFAYECASEKGGTDILTATFYRTEPPMVLVERQGQARPAFQVVAASGAKYEGQDVMFWDARGEATATWSSIELKCKRK